MKYWLTGVLTLLMASSTWAQNYNIASSRTKNLDVWIDNVRGQDAQDWCARQVPLRIVLKGDKSPTVLNDFLPKVGALMVRDCSKLKTLNWQTEDALGRKLATGTAEKASGWRVKVVAETPVIRPEALSPLADTTPWLQFSLLDGCYFRTWWREEDRTAALFIPETEELTCNADGWLSGQSQLVRLEHGEEKQQPVTFLDGFPVIGLVANSDKHALQITTVNNERMVLADERSPQSWMILPWSSSLNSWQATGAVAVQISPEEENDESALKARLSEVRKVWIGYLSDAPLTLLLVDELHPQLKDPAAGAWRTIK
ncbi:hypothetical protein [Mixta intestinalis]|jgi:hypothetical protein|uniref:Uncharacterized protein n=1 Tax=Mixta intestinalis TaxID=1615494 RepID=A0A6P1Q7Y5_9GAMM|nr:hypothetical protein [Mixta intestinalis]QHM73905.1 hypothetical protein C7M51_04266 [Mixta intestinalis]